MALEASAERAEFEHQARVWSAYHVGLMIRSDKPPTFEELGGKVPPREPQADHDMLFALKAWAIATGGTINGERPDDQA